MLKYTTTAIEITIYKYIRIKIYIVKRTGHRVPEVKNVIHWQIDF